METKPKELIYSCSGCSSAAQTANAVAVRLDRNNIVEMSKKIQHGNVDDTQVEVLFHKLKNEISNETL